MNRSVIAIGLQQTGKTSFLAAFWDVVCSGEITDSIQLERTDGDMTYLNEIRAAWADYVPITRTGPASDKRVTMQLKETGTAKGGQLIWSDMLGESFERQWTDRAWTRAYGEMIQSVTGALLFLHPRRTLESPLIIQARKLKAVLGAEEQQATNDGSGVTTGEPTKFDARKVPTQVPVVELLQFIAAHMTNTVVPRLAVVISAWDLVEKAMKITPCEWLKAHVPLLAQYLSSNDDRYDYSVFGVSAQGCDYGRGEEESLRKKHHRASDRIKIVDVKKSLTTLLFRCASL